MERQVLSDECLDYNITFVTEIPFLDRYLLIACQTLQFPTAQQLNTQTRFYAELTLIHYPFSLFKPSTVALSCISLALYTLNLDPWPLNLNYHSQEDWYSQPLKQCIQMLEEFVKNPLYPNLTATYDNFKDKTILPVPRELIHTRYP